MAKRKTSVESIQETQEKLNKVGEALGIIDKIELEKPEEILKRDIVLSKLNDSNYSRLEETLELATMIEDFNFMRDTLRYNIEKSKVMMSCVSEGFNAYSEDSAMLISGYASLVKAVNDSVSLFSNLHRTLNQIIEKRNQIENKKDEANENNSNKKGLSISEITKLISKSENPIDVEFSDSSNPAE